MGKIQSHQVIGKTFNGQKINKKRKSNLVNTSTPMSCTPHANKNSSIHSFFNLEKIFQYHKISDKNKMDLVNSHPFGSFLLIFLKIILFSYIILKIILK